MDQNALVREWVAAGQELLTRLQDAGWKFTAVFWANLAAEERWQLYLANPGSNNRGSRPLYTAVRTTLAGEGGAAPNTPIPFLSLEDVAALDSTDPMARDVEEMAEKYPNQVGRWHRTHLIGGKMVNGLYIYPLPVPAA